LAVLGAPVVRGGATTAPGTLALFVVLPSPTVTGNPDAPTIYLVVDMVWVPHQVIRVDLAHRVDSTRLARQVLDVTTANDIEGVRTPHRLIGAP
jgi:hypothetical protein